MLRVAGGLASAERVNGLGQFLKAGVVIRFEHLALDGREVNFDLVEPACVGLRMHDLTLAREYSASHPAALFNRHQLSLAGH